MLYDRVLSLLAVEFKLSIGQLLTVLLGLLICGVSWALFVCRKKQKDVLTDTLHANHIDTSLEQQIAKAKLQNSYFGVLLVDIDNFRSVNNSYHHEIGNNVLTQMVGVIRPRSHDEKIFRYGGDEFLIIAKLGMSKEDCWGFGNRIVNEISKYPFVGKVNSNPIKLTISCGCILAGGNDAVDEIRHRLARALKEAKKQKNCAYILDVSEKQKSWETRHQNSRPSRLDPGAKR